MTDSNVTLEDPRVGRVFPSLDGLAHLARQAVGGDSTR
jgi:hypothetical protein